MKDRDSSSLHGQAFAWRVGEVLKEERWSQAEAARKGGTTEVNVSRWLAGTLGKADLILKVSEQWGYSAGWLLTGQGPRKTAHQEPETDLGVLREAIRALMRLEGRLGGATTPAEADELMDQVDAARDQGTQGSQKRKGRGGR